MVTSNKYRYLSWYKTFELVSITEKLTENARSEPQILFITVTNKSYQKTKVDFKRTIFTFWYTGTVLYNNF
jgi:hypothetical protein